jgi:transcriptional regulator with XRE-family HTH domain
MAAQYPRDSQVVQGIADMSNFAYSGIQLGQTGGNMAVVDSAKILGRGPTLGSALKSIRLERQWSLADASSATGLSISTWSKIENGQRSLTYDKLLQLSRALDVDIARLFSEDAQNAGPDLHVGRRSVQRGEEGFVIEAGIYTYRYLAQDLVRKRFTPVLMELHARSINEFEDLLRHEGDEFAIVLEGVAELHTEVYEPLRLEVGESVYFDSRVGHAYLNAGPGVTKIMTIACDSSATQEAKQLPVARASKRLGLVRDKAALGKVRATRSARS